MTDSLSDYKPVSVVIATLGGPTLPRTITSLNSGSLVPAEILICIPQQEAGRVADLAFPNVRVLITDFRGQVAQRAHGFKHAAHDFVMQLDDDMLLDHDCLALLVRALLQHGARAAVAPALIDLASGGPAYTKPGRNRVLQNLYYWLMNGADGYQQGKIDKAGSPVGIVPDGRNEVVVVEWLAGGCVLHRKENLVLDNFFPFKGKAFCEDVIHSHLLQTRGVTLLVEPRAICRLELVYSSGFRTREYLRNLSSDFRARRYFMKLSARSSARMYLFYAISGLSYFGKKAVRLVTGAGRTREQ
jgi:glycosyltransferase involved in cell wall biosynthesis